MVRKCKNNEINKKKRALLGYALKHEGKTKVKEKKGIEKRERKKNMVRTRLLSMAVYIIISKHQLQ